MAYDWTIDVDAVVAAMESYKQDKYLHLWKQALKLCGC